jgi:hypothetical protein
MLRGVALWFFRGKRPVAATNVVEAVAQKKDGRCLTGVDVLRSTRVSVTDYAQRERVAS